MTKRLFLPLSLAVTLTFFLLWPLWSQLNTGVPGDIGDPLLNTWIMAWDAHAIITGANIWDANIFYPLTGTLAYSEHLLGPAILALPVQAWGEPLLAYNLTLAAAFALSFLAVYFLSRELRYSPTASVLAAGIFAFGPYHFALLSHLQLLLMPWLPLALLAWERYRHCRHWQALLAMAIFMVMQVSVGWYAAVFSLAVFAVWLAFTLITAKTPPGWAFAGALLPLVAVLLLLAWPYAQSLGTLRQQRPQAVAAYFSVQWPDFVTAIESNRLWGTVSAALRQHPKYNGEHALYLGWVAWAAAVAGGWQWPRSRRPLLILLLLILCLGLLFAAGPSINIGKQTVTLPWGYAVQLLPPLQAVRVPTRWLTVVSLALALLAGNATRKRRLNLALTALCLIEGLSLPLPISSVGSLAGQSAVYKNLQTDNVPGAVLELPLYAAPAPEYPETRRLYASAGHWRPLVNGYSGITPPRQTELAAEFANFPDASSLEALQRLAVSGVSYLIVHPGEGNIDADQWQTIDRWQLAALPEMRLEAVSAGAWLYRLYDISGKESSSELYTPATARWQNGIELLGYRWDAEAPFGPTLTLFWRSSEPIGTDLTIFVHYLDAQGQIIGQADGDPISGHLPTSQWLPGQILRDEHSGGTGDTSIAVGWYDRNTGQRVPLSTGEERLVLIKGK